LRTPEYDEIRRDYDEKSRVCFPGGYRRPTDLPFSHSEALFPIGDVRLASARDYESQCRLLFYGSYPTFEEVLVGFEELRDWL
jgi:hypothetical protein